MIRLISVPKRKRTNQYLENWYKCIPLMLCHEVINDAKYYKLSIFNIKWILNNYNSYDILHLHWQFQKVGIYNCLVTFILNRILGKKLIWTIHEPIPHDKKNCIQNYIVNFFLLRFADVLISHNLKVNQYVKKYYLTNRHINLIEHPDYKIHTIDKEIAKSLIAEKCYMFLFFGFLKDYKGINELIWNFNSKELNAVLYIIGQFSNSDIDDFKLKINRNGVKLLSGEMSDYDLDNYICASDAVILPYKNCFTSGALHRSIQHDKLLLVSKQVYTSISEKKENIIKFDSFTDLGSKLNIIRDIKYESHPNLKFNIDTLSYQKLVRSIYELNNE